MSTNQAREGETLSTEQAIELPATDGSAILQRRMPLCMVGTYRDWHDCQHEDIDARIKTERDMVLWCDTETNTRVQYRVIRRTETVTYSPNAGDERRPE